MLNKLETESFGKYITRLRENKGYSQRKLAQVTGISNTTISRIEKDITTNPDLNTLKLLSKYLDVDEIYMLKASGYKDENSLEKENAQPELSKKDEKDIEKRLKQVKEEFMEQQKGLMLSGEPVSEEALQSILDALEFGMKQAKIINKKYTPKQYRKE
ncbi:MAG: helix-turn-helix transcriptional regulator [Bacillota bacterium]|nr:helix-turn-helix transcriptional regulator [Bacillota bacterium]